MRERPTAYSRRRLPPLSSRGRCPPSVSRAVPALGPRRPPGVSVTPPRVALLSLEPWDEVWRRNQHLASQLVAQDLASHLVFVEPPALRPAPVRRPLPGITVV